MEPAEAGFGAKYEIATAFGLAMTNVDSASPANGLLGQARMVRYRRIKMTIFDRFLGYARNDSRGISNDECPMSN